MPTEIYEKLRERLDKFPQGFPQTRSGVEIEVLKTLFSPLEAQLMLHIRPYPELAETIIERAAKKDLEVTKKILYELSRKGLILRYRASEEDIYYFLVPWMIGIWEFQVKRLNAKNIQLYEKFFEEGMIPSARKRKIPGIRVIPVEKEIRNTNMVEPFEKVSEIIEKNTKFAVAECICRKESRILGHDCGKLAESCLSFGVGAEYYIENGFAREITKDEAKQIITKAEEDGLIHFSSNHEGEKVFICNCCGCCCKALAHINKYGISSVIGQSNYYAFVNSDSCSSCELCLDRCQINAISIDDYSAQVDRQHCIGCGLCVSTCPTGAMTLKRKSPGELSPTFANDSEFMQALSDEADKPYPFK